MSKTDIHSTSPAWGKNEKIALRFLFIYFFIQAVPLDWKFYRDLFSINWLDLHYGDIFQLTRYFPRFFPGSETFANWLVVIVLAVIGAVIWTKKESVKTDYNKLYYLLRVIVRYRLAIGIIGYGFLKFFPLQAPFPSISNLNTNYGDLGAWKIFSMSLGIAPGYESFLGAVELLTGFLLLFRRTASVGAFLILVFTGNVFMSNLAYDGGEYVYSFYLVVLALFVLAYDAGRLYRLVALQYPTEPGKYKPQFTSRQKTARVVLKSLVIFFFVFLYGYKTYSGFKNDLYQFPATAGLAGASGIYNVREFRVNNQVHPYSATDPLRWKDVVFETWATISVRSNRPVILDSTNAEQVFKRDRDRVYELASSGSRHYYSYSIDTVKKTLLLENKNKHYKGETLVLHYSRPDTSSLILSGIDQNRDSIYVVLDKIHKKYPVKLGRRGSLKL